MAKSKATAKVQTASKPSLAELLKQKAQSSNSYRVSIPADLILEFNPEAPETETMTIMGQPRQVVKWNVQIDGKNAIANFMVGQVGRLYDAIAKEQLPEGVSLSDAEQTVVVLTDRFTVNARGVKTPNGNLGFLNLTPLTVKNSATVETVSGFQYAE